VPAHHSTASSDALDSWKEIAVYLHRDLRTVMRWEQSRGMPVHRLPGGSAVYASKSELDRWRESGGIHVVDPEAEATPAAKAVRPSVAVLQFVNLTDEKENEYFGDGLADEVINALTRVEGLRVTARTSSFAFRGKEQDVRELGGRLGVEYLLEGSVQRAADRIRVSAQLVSTSDGFHLWSDRYDRNMTDIFSIQDEIAGAIVAAFKLRVKAPSAARPRAANLEAYQAWLKGRRYRLGAKTLQDFIVAGECFSQAVALDPNFGAAHLAVGQHLIDLAIFGLVPPRQICAHGRTAVTRALELDPSLGEAHAVLAQYLALFEFDWTGAENAFLGALACEPGCAMIHRRFAGTVLAPLARLEQAEAESAISMELDPLCPESHLSMAMMLFFRRQYDRAEASIRTTLELGGANPFVLWIGGVIAALQGRSEEAITKCEESVRLFGKAPMLAAALGMIYARTGRTAEARAVLVQLDQAAASMYVSPLNRALVYTGLGETDEAIQWLERAIEARDPHILHLPVKPVWDSLRGDPRFDGLLRKMRLPAR
jgi:adenylate cyclase